MGQNIIKTFCHKFVVNIEVLRLLTSYLQIVHACPLTFFLQQMNVKINHVLGFELVTSWVRVSSRNHLWEKL